jgi:hypothetical protein
MAAGVKIFWIVSQGLANLADGGVAAVLGIDKDFAGPQTLNDLRSGDQAPICRHQ